MPQRKTLFSDGSVSLIPVISYANLYQQRHIKLRCVAHVHANFIADLIDQILTHFQNQFIVHLQDDLGVEA